MVVMARALVHSTDISSVAPALNCSLSKSNPGSRSMMAMFCSPPRAAAPRLKLNFNSFNVMDRSVVGCVGGRESFDSKVQAKNNTFVGLGEKRFSRIALPEALLERFTEQAIKVIMLAQDEARRLSHNFIGTEHLLLGLRREDTSIAAKALISFNHFVEDIRLKVAKLNGRGSGFVTMEIPFMPRAKRVLEHALDEALQFGHSYVAPEHILLGLIREGEGAGVNIMEWLRAPLDEIRTLVIEMIHKDGEIPMAAMMWKQHKGAFDYQEPLENYPKEPTDYEDLKPANFSFEKPLLDLDETITQLNRVIETNKLRDFYEPVRLLELKLVEVMIHSHDHLTQIQRMSVARHPFRPTVIQYIENITHYWELHGDQEGYDDDPAIVGGIGNIEGECYMFIGHQKFRNIEENSEHYFAVPTPQGYKKALRMMKFAEHCGFPIVIFVDTTGSFANLESEKLGQDEAIADNLRTIFGLKVPIITVVTGEGGPGGALAIACANKLLMLENSAFYVASQDVCAAILHKYSSAGLKTPAKLNITAQKYRKLRIAGCLIPECENGAHAYLNEAYSTVQNAILKAIEEVRGLGSEELMRHRMLKFEAIGEIGYNNKKDGQAEQENKRKMKPSIVKALKTAEIESQLEELTMKFLTAEGIFDPVILPGDKYYVNVPFKGFPILP